MHQLLQQLINGLSLGSIYALIALGYTMIYGILKLINFATVISIWWALILGILRQQLSSALFPVPSDCDGGGSPCRYAH